MPWFAKARTASLIALFTMRVLSARSALVLFILAGMNYAHASKCPSTLGKYTLQSQNGAWTDTEFFLTQRQDWGLIDLDDDLSFPVPLPKIQDTKITGPNSPSVQISEAPPGNLQPVAASFFVLGGGNTCPLLLVISADGKQAFSIKFDPADGSPLAAYQIDLSAIGSTPVSISTENIDKAGGEELVARSPSGLLVAVFTRSGESQIAYDPLMTVEGIWLDFIDRAAANDPQALKYMVPELEAAYSAQDSFAALTTIKALQKDSDFTDINARWARLAIILTSGGKDYLHFVLFEKKSSGWYIASI